MDPKNYAYAVHKCFEVITAYLFFEEKEEPFTLRIDQAITQLVRLSSAGAKPPAATLHAGARSPLLNGGPVFLAIFFLKKSFSFLSLY